jgi:hypothetical protein
MTPRLPSTLRLLVALFAVSFLVLPGELYVVNAQVFSVDAASPLKRAADLFTPGPTLYAPAESIGLLAADDIDALSFGFDDVRSRVFNFSVNFFATGASVSGNAVCSETGLCSPGAPCAPEAAADVFRTSGLGTATLLFDGDGVPGTAPSLGLKECPAGGPGVQDNVDAFDDLVAPLDGGRPAWRVYFSLAPGSPTLAGANPELPGGAGPADILVYDPGQNSLSVYFTAANLGLLAGDNIDGLSLDALTGDLVISLAPGSPSLPNAAICPGGCTAGDLIRAPGLLCGPIPCLSGGLSFAAAGMAPNDNVDEVDQPGEAPKSLSDDVSPGKTYSLDPRSPSLKMIKTKNPSRRGSPADLLTQDLKHPNSAPNVVYRAESLGLVPEDDIDGLSFGLEPMFAPGGKFAVEFSVDRAAAGSPGTGVFTEAGASGGGEASSDIFESFLPAPPAPPVVPRNRQNWDGNGSSAPDLELREASPTEHVGDDLDALEGPAAIVDTNRDGVRDLPIYFSLAPGSPTLASIGASPADILVCQAPSGGVCGSSALPTVFIGHADLGLATGDNLEDFVLDAGTGDVDFTVSPGTGFAPGAILVRPGYAGCSGPGPCTIVTPADIGLLANDNMNALDSLTPVEVCVTITPGSDPAIRVAHGVCGPASPVVIPYDVIEGELGELTEGHGEVNLSRVFCRADALPVDRITLAGGADPFTRPRLILVRNKGASDYGLSSRGNPRHPSAGDCP